MNMTKQEELMYSILGELSNSNIPLIFKGGLINRLLLQEQSYNDIYRLTKDIDANWVGVPPSLEDLSSSIANAIKDKHSNLEVKATRDFGEKKSAKVVFTDTHTGTDLVTMDIDIYRGSGHRTYYYGTASFNGVLPIEILLDKISSSSTDLIYKWRTKDLLDVYMLCHCFSFKIKDIFDYSKTYKRDIKDFSAFLQKKNEIEHAYDRLYSVYGKPEFNEVYTFLDKVFTPFREGIQKDFFWNSEKLEWQNSSKYLDLSKAFVLNKNGEDILEGKLYDVGSKFLLDCLEGNFSTVYLKSPVFQEKTILFEQKGNIICANIDALSEEYDLKTNKNLKHEISAFLDKADIIKIIDSNNILEEHSERVITANNTVHDNEVASLNHRDNSFDIER